MIIDISGDALKLLKDFIKYSTGENSGCVASALFYCEDALIARALRLDNAVCKAELEDNRISGVNRGF